MHVTRLCVAQFGMDNVDVYMQPCYKCGQPADQVKAMIAYLEENGVQPDEQAPNGYVRLDTWWHATCSHGRR